MKGKRKGQQTVKEPKEKKAHKVQKKHKQDLASEDIEQKKSWLQAAARRRRAWLLAATSRTRLWRLQKEEEERAAGPAGWLRGLIGRNESESAPTYISGQFGVNCARVEKTLRGSRGLK